MPTVDTTAIRPDTLALVEVFTFSSGVSVIRHAASTPNARVAPPS